MVRDPLREKYNRQKFHAKRRGIGFHITYPEWLEWWGEDIHLRGRGMGKLQMCRKNDWGDYTLDNVFKGTHEQNMRDKKTNGTHRAKPKSLDWKGVEQVKQLLDLGISTRKVAVIVGCSQRTVVHVKNKTGSYA